MSQIRDRLADDQRVGQRRGGPDGFVVRSVAGDVAVSLEGADEVRAAEFLDADVGAFEVQRENPVLAVALGELADVFGWQGDARVEVFELDLLGFAGREWEALARDRRRGGR